MLPPLQSLFIFLLYLHLLCPRVQCHRHARSPSTIVFSFIPSTAPHLRSIGVLLTHCCPDAKLISHNNFTLNHLNILSVPRHQYQVLQSIRPRISSLPNLRVLPSPLNEQALVHPLRQSSEECTTSTSTPNFDCKFYTKYHTFDALQAKWDQLADRYSFLEKRVIGKSYDGRDIVLLKIGDTDSDNPKRILINGLQHAREWISAAANTFIAETLAGSYAAKRNEDDSDLQRILRSVQVLIVPVVNPDGYEYTRTDDRNWRKNRRPFREECSPESSSLDEDGRRVPGGVDLNRNWGKDFGGEYSSGDPCHILYRGERAFSEPETRALSNFIRETRGIMAHIDFHSYGQVILGPWASSDELPTRSCDYSIVGNEMGRRMFASSGTKYTYGSGFQIPNFAASGVMADWIHQEFQETLSFTVELRPAGMQLDTGFDLPIEEIVPNSREAFEAVKMLLDYADDPDRFLRDYRTGPCPQATVVPPGLPEKGGSNDVVLKAGVSVGVILLVVILSCILVLVIRRRRSREKELEVMNTSPNGDTAREGGSLESVCAVVEKVRLRPIPLAAIEGNEPSSNETLNVGTLPSELLSTVSNDCITPVCAEEGASAWYSMEGEDSYGNTVLLDAQNPFFPGQSPPAVPRKSDSS